LFFGKENYMDDLVPCLGVIGTLIVILGSILLMRYITYKETLALAEKGLSLSEPATGSKGFLRWGIVLTALGVALTIGLYPLGLSNTGSNYPLGLGPWILAGLIPLFLGLSVFIR
jgi:hypothetical protein